MAGKIRRCGTPPSGQYAIAVTGLFSAVKATYRSRYCLEPFKKFRKLNSVIGELRKTGLGNHSQTGVRNPDILLAIINRFADLTGLRVRT